MKSQSNTIRKFVSFINNPNESGGYWLPNIQRHFVWKEEQIERLYDSIMREYPIGSLLIWKNNSSIKTRKFIDNFKVDINPNDFSRPVDEDSKMLVLDGQQRIQSLFIGLKGSYDGKELYFDVLSGDLAAPDDIKYDFNFMSRDKAKFPWIKFKDYVNTDKRQSELRRDIEASAEQEIDTQSKRRIEDNVEKIRDIFCTQQNIIYQTVDSIDRPETYTEDDIVEIFIRANSGGTTLSKSDLMFSLLTASWEDADENMGQLLEELNRTGYRFTRDFILKTCLVVLNKGAKYEIDKFRKPEIKTHIELTWDKIENTISDVKDFLYGNTFLKTDKQVPSYNVLMPLLYLRYHFPKVWNDKKQDIQKYLLRTSLTGAFSGSSDALIDKVVKHIKENQSFDLPHVLDEIREAGRNLKVSQDTIMSLQYTSKEVHLFFNIWYGFNYQPARQQNQPQIDHIFPQSELKQIKDISPETGRRSIMRYRKWHRDQIANLMLLTQEENGSGGKTDILPEEWFADKSDEYLELHLIPKNRELWKLEKFEEFTEARKNLILEKFDYLIYKDTEE